VKEQLSGVTSFETRRLAEGSGVEIEGILGFSILQDTTISIDYRDNLIQVIYDPTHKSHDDFPVDDHRLRIP